MVRIQISPNARQIDVPETFAFWFSDDRGASWSAPEPVAALPDGRRPITDAAMKFLVEGDWARAGLGRIVSCTTVHPLHTRSLAHSMPPFLKV
jgi:hypothetical protein